MSRAQAALDNPSLGPIIWQPSVPVKDSMASDKHIVLDRVSHTYQTASGPLPVLNDLSLSIPKSKFCAVVGPSGCGKSTLTRLVAGLLIPDEGSVMLGGERIKSPRSTVGMAFQNPVLLEWRSILQNVLLPLEIVKNKLSTAQRVARAKELLALVGLAGFEDKRPSELSGGMRQRASLCRALVHRPQVLILDEPFGALDAFTREDLWKTMHSLRHTEQFTCVLITHDLRESVFLADEVVVLSNRPATVQTAIDVPLGPERELRDLYSPDITKLLSDLRDQIEVAQGRATAAQVMASANQAGPA